MRTVRLYSTACLLLLLWLLTCAASSFDPPRKGVRLRTFSMADGLPSNSIAMINPDDRGLIWIATWNGLCNFDGYRFNSFGNAPGEERVLHGNRLNYVMPASNGDVWVTTFDNRLFLLDASERRFVDCAGRLSELGLDDFRVSYMQRLPDGTLWIEGVDGVNLIADDSALSRTDKQFGKPDTESFSDSRGRLWSIDKNGDIICRAPSSDPETFTCVMPDTWTRISIDRPLILEDRSGTVWFLPNGKTVCYFDESSHRVVPVNLREVAPTLPNEIDVTHPMVDKHKNLWFRSRFNLCSMSFGDTKFKYFPVIEDAETRALFIGSDGMLWVGTKQGYIALVDAADESVKFLSPEGRRLMSPAIFDPKGVYTILEDRNHNIWVGTRGSGLYCLTPAGDSFDVKHFARLSDGKDADYGHIYDIKEDSNGRLWFASYGGGVICYDPDESRFLTADNLPNLRLPPGNIRKVRRIETAADGTLLFSTTEGIITLNPNFKTPDEIKLFVTQYAPNNDDSLLAPDVLQTLISKHGSDNFVATVGGVLQYIKSDNLLESPLRFGIVEREIGSVGNIRGMTEDNQAAVWFIGENAIHWLGADGSSHRTFTTNDFGRNLQFSEVNPIQDPRTGNVIVGTLDGIIYFDPQTLESTSNVPPIVFTGIQYQGNEKPTSLIGNGEITMPTDRRNAIIYFAALDYEDNEQIRYAYRIRELDEQWSFVGAEHCTSLSNLPPGHYTLEVRSTNNEGVWVDNNAELRIYVEPTFWQTPWAWLIYIVIAGLVIFAVVYMLWLRNAHKVEKLMKEQQLRFFTDISHQLRTPLTLIGSPVSEVLKNEKLSETAGKLLRSVESNAAKMLTLVNQTLDLKKLQSLNAEAVSAELPESDGSLPTEGDTSFDTEADPKSGSALTILVVEDNDDLRYLLRTSLSKHYTIIEAENGMRGLALAAERQPDFIITDIMMPEMDGITMIRRIKGNEAISHIPIIILSARTADAYRIEGLKEGADDYITKPFSMSYLRARVESIIHQRRTLQEEWRRNLTSKTSHSDRGAAETPADSLPEIDRRFVKKLTDFVGANLHNPELKIDDIASAMCMSRTVFYSKVKAIYGLSPSDMLRNSRIARACTLLRDDPSMSVADVARAVGYNDAKHFARNFKETVGATPSAYRKGV